MDEPPHPSHHPDASRMHPTHGAGPPTLDVPACASGELAPPPRSGTAKTATCGSSYTGRVEAGSQWATSICSGEARRGRAQVGARGSAWQDCLRVNDAAASGDGSAGHMRAAGSAPADGPSG